MYRKYSLFVVLLITLITTVTYAGQIFLTGTIFPWAAKKKVQPLEEIRIGLLPVEENLPFLVAQEKGYFKESGLKVRFIPFSSALELNSALQAKEIDGQVSDLVISAQLEDNGFDVGIVSLCLGATGKEGRFALLTAPGSTINKVEELAGVPIAISNNSIVEYVTDRLLAKGKVPPTERKYVLIRPLSIRMDMLLRGQVKAATLPDPLAASAVKAGARLLADDTGDNLSQTFIVFRQAFLDAHPKEMKKFLSAYTLGVEELNKNPEQYRKTLARQGGIPENIAQSYSINKFPVPELPAQADVDKVLNWMKKRGIVSSEIVYEKLVDQRFCPKR